MSKRPGPHAKKAERRDFIIPHLKASMQPLLAENREPNQLKGYAIGGAVKAALDECFDLALVRLAKLKESSAAASDGPYIGPDGPITTACLISGIAALEAAQRER